MSYRVFSVQGRPLLATPAAPRRLRLAALQRLHPVGRRRRAYQGAVRLAMRLGLDGLLSRAVDEPVGDLPRRLRELGEMIGAPQIAAAVLWPPEPQRGRLYLHLFDRGCRPVGFAKLSLDAANDEPLRREAELLSELAGLSAVRVPAVLACDRLEGRVVVAMEALPESARPLANRLDAFPREAVEAFAGPAREAADVTTLSWWSRYAEVGDATPFDRELRGLAAGGCRVRRAHGDFGPSNIFRSPEGLWVIDWEDSAPDAPALADEITFDLGVNRAAIAADPLAALRDFGRRRLASGRADVMLAVAFRAALGRRDAGLYIRHWDRLP